MTLERIVKPHIRGLAPYEPGKPPEELERELGIEGAIKLASNESPIGPSPRAVAALGDEAHAERSRRVNAEGIDYLTRELRALDVEVWPTDANFLLVRAGEGIFDKLQREGVIVRPLVGFGMPDCVRVTIGLPEENERLVKTLAKLLGRKS